MPTADTAPCAPENLAAESQPRWQVYDTVNEFLDETRLVAETLPTVASLRDAE